MKPLRVLLVEDSERDAALLLRELTRAGYSPEHRRVENAQEMTAALEGGEWDVVLSDYVLPHFDGLAAISLVQKKGLDLPIIIVSGQIGEDTATATMRAGARDYIMKDNLKRLGPALQRELAEAESRRQARKSEEELRAREDDLRLARKLDAIKDEFIGMVSHELKTPLTVIIGALALADEEGVTVEESRDLIHDALTNAEALADIVDNLLELSRHQYNRLALQAEQTDIGQVAHAVLQKLQARTTKHHLVADIPADLPAANIDRIRIERVLHNLVENAIKYSPNGGEVKVSARREDGKLVIGISDQGIGISPEDLPKLFQSFQRLQIHRKQKIAGIGLGLRVCRTLVEAHGGKIWAESTLGTGTTFWFTLPMDDASQAKD